MLIFPSGPVSLKNNHAFIFYRTKRLIPRFEKADQTYDQQTLTLEQARILVAAMLVLRHQAFTTLSVPFGSSQASPARQGCNGKSRMTSHVG